MFHYIGWFVSLNTPARRQIFINSVTLYALEAKSADILNAYMMAHNHEKIWTILGLEFWYDAKSDIIVRALYRLNSVVASFWAHLTYACGNRGIFLVMQTLTCG